MSQFRLLTTLFRSGLSCQSFNCLMPALAVGLLLAQGISHADDLRTYKPAVRLDSPEMKDQDDMCVWVHPTAPEKSSVICSDKTANALFVYDLAGNVIQHIPTHKPGNIDIRQRVQIDGKSVDLVVYNQRADGFKLCVYRVNGESRKLERMDDNLLTTGPNYGGCLYHSKKSGRLYCICTSDRGTVEQYELVGNGQGGISHKKVRSFPLGKCEGAVADDENATLYIGEEKGGVWKFGAEPDAPNQGTLIAKVGEHGMKGDVEGLAILPQGPRNGYLVVSDQGQNRFKIYQREAPHTFVGDFAIEGAEDSDGIEICPVNLGPGFPNGVFACHTGLAPHCVLLTPLSEILKQVPKATAAAVAK